jgi:hypothetical protein
MDTVGGVVSPEELLTVTETFDDVPTLLAASYAFALSV